MDHRTRPVPAGSEAWISDLGGIPWHQAPPPRRWHKHWAQTSGATRSGMRIERCPCGAMREPTEPWTLLDKPRVAPASDEQIHGRLLAHLTRPRMP